MDGLPPSIQIERVAINLRDARTPDNAGFQPHDQPVVDSAPDAFFATIPTRQITERLRAAGIPAALSYSAGTYVCNNLLYAALYENSQAGKGNSARCGFIHVPYLPDQAAAAVSNAPSMSLKLMVQALTIAVGTIAECR